jgi:transcriptional regulator with XRE-family HTH domain
MIRLRELREAAGLEVKDMCRKLGVADSRYRKWESGTNGVPLDYALMICDVLHCTLDELSGHTPKVLTEDERHLLDLYRACSPQGRETMLAMAETTAQLFGGE